ncbi:MAG TPA: DUF1801 domain-containing protein [Candidatus Limnocylindria bacterium]|nr:DUF1801 domain-containing protein [Candidatus Limnocylindria bacterium]
MEPDPVDVFLAAHPAPIAELANGLRDTVRRAVPDALERVRPGWRLIGYDVPQGRAKRYFAYVAPELEHVHLGFEFGIWLEDPQRLLEGEHLRLRKVRYLTYRPGDRPPERHILELVRQAARVALLSRNERMSLALDRDAAAADVRS